jgi:hypothetical protein
MAPSKPSSVIYARYSGTVRGTDASHVNEAQIKKQPSGRWLLKRFGYAVPEYECTQSMRSEIPLYDVKIKVCSNYRFLFQSKTKKPSG